MIVDLSLMWVSVMLHQGSFNKYSCQRPDLYEVCVDNDYKHMCLEIKHIIPDLLNICPYYTCSYKCIQKKYVVYSIETSYNNVGFYLLIISAVIFIFNVIYLQISSPRPRPRPRPININNPIINEELLA